MFDWPLPPGEPFTGETLRADGWEYRDIPGRLTPEMWDLLLSRIGEGNYRILAMSMGTNAKGEDWVRGQLFISPAGFEQMRRKPTDASKDPTHD